jgi:Dienelactone hydrolase family
MNIKFYGSILVFLMISGCCLFYEPPPLALQVQKQNDICQWQQSDKTKLTKDDIALDKNFSPFKENIAFDHDYLLCSTDDKKMKPPVILLHEILGVEGKTIAYAKTLAKDFTVYVPRLIGDRNTGNDFKRGLWNYKFTWLPKNDEWEQKEELNGSMLVTQWLRKFIKTVVQNNHNGQHIGIIGNCLTGALPLALLDNNQVTGVVLAQPTLPITMFYDPENLEISKQEWETAKDRVNTKGKSKLPPAKAYLTRFAFDSKAKIEKYEFLVRELSPHLDCAHFPSKESNLICNQVKPEEYSYSVPAINPGDNENKKIDHCAHSVLIGEWKNEENHPSQIRRNEIRKFLLDPN